MILNICYLIVVLLLFDIGCYFINNDTNCYLMVVIYDLIFIVNDILVAK